VASRGNAPSYRYYFTCLSYRDSGYDKNACFRALPGLKETKCYSLITQAVFPIYLTIREIVFIIRIIELKSVFLRSKTSMRPATPGTLIGTLPMKPTCIAYTNTFLYNFH
jgi:hypothetical protein